MSRSPFVGSGGPPLLQEYFLHPSKNSSGALCAATMAASSSAAPPRAALRPRRPVLLRESFLNPGRPSSSWNSCPSIYDSEGRILYIFSDIPSRRPLSASTMSNKRRKEARRKLLHWISPVVMKTSAPNRFDSIGFGPIRPIGISCKVEKGTYQGQVDQKEHFSAPNPNKRLPLPIHLAIATSIESAR
ncbi:hypothetical protein QR680_004618 [Steinernema hermaphroditum]|uniref:Uncharacterized protein n=1 Tax=Steinernema hermaphroditum TaxID=289476 RepID=A0AA39HQE9_9BILA|nr:hypothetical protein QR680_004618 [Steinernema hermaphroditum]